MTERVDENAELAVGVFDCQDGVCVLPGGDSATQDQCSQAPSRELVVPFRATWKFWDKQSSPPQTWMDVEFDDEQWPVGSAPVGYFFREEGTHIPTGDRVAVRQPAYFRHEFWFEEEPDPGTMWKLAVHREGGIVISFNGRERFRDNAGLTPAPSSKSWPPGWTASETEHFPLQYSVYASYLRKGKNILAVEARPYGHTLCFDLALGEGDAPISRHPVFPARPKPLSAGAFAPDLEWLEIEWHQARSLKDFRGKKLIVELLGTHCSTCWEQIPKLQHWAEQLKKIGVAVAAISCLGTVADVEHLLKRHRHLFPDVVFGSEPLAGDFFTTMAYQEFHIMGTPTLLLVDESGVIRASGYGTGGAGYDQFLAQAASIGINLPEFVPYPPLEVVVNEEGELSLK